MKFIMKMKKELHGKYFLGFRVIFMAQSDFRNKFSPPEISRIRENGAEIPGS